jgi:hypothetical protein
MYFECFNNIRIPQTTPTTYSITIWIGKQLEVPINRNFRSSFLESSVSHLEMRAQKLFYILKDDEHELEAQLSTDAIFLSILVRVGQAVIPASGRSLAHWDPTSGKTGLVNLA